MKRLLIFSGTTEGRTLAEVLSEAGIPAVVCVATEYGKQTMPELPGITLHQGRMDAEEMKAFMEQETFLAVVDATHPFAVEVSKHIRESAGVQKLPYLRLKRNTKHRRETGRYFADHASCAAALEETEGKILLTTGSKELAVYTQRKELRERLCVRVLPSEESISLCRKAGLSGGQILALQGPFSAELNEALIRQYGIRCVVTKESGAAGGFVEKVRAAKKTGTALFIIGNPEQTEGFSFAEVVKKLQEMTGKALLGRKALNISLVGAGMGDRSTLTFAAEEQIRKADVLFGARRLLAAVNAWNIGNKTAEAYPYYRAEDILPVLSALGAKKSWKEPDGKKTAEAVVLFSGDSGFCSGAQKLSEALAEWKRGREEAVSIRIYPGISSVAYFAAACGVSWQDARLMSIHGKGGRDAWEPELLEAVRYEKKVFLLVSGAKDVRTVGEILTEAGLEDLEIRVGHQLSGPEESIRVLSAGECTEVEAEGLYLLLIQNEACERKYLAPQKKDGEFLRGKIPMTKEEVRELAVCKLRLWDGAVVYDIGSGTGSVAAEIAARSAGIRVYAFEQKEEGAALIRKNQKNLGLANIRVIQGKAPEVLLEFPAPTHAFIGGSGGNLKEILAALYDKNPSMRVVMTAVSLETIGKMTGILSEFPVCEEEIIQVQVSRARQAGACHLMQAENPVYLSSFTFVPEEEKETL